AVIALYAGSSPAWMHAALSGPLAGLAAAGFLAACLLLLLPTALMGAALPLLARAVVHNVADSAGTIGRLYGVNTLGAAAGALVGGCLLVGNFGYVATAAIAGVCNLVVAAGVLRLRPAAPQAIADAAPPGDARSVALWCARVAVSGFLVVGLQILWFRLLGAMMQASAYGFAIILAVFLLGDAIGLFIGARIAPRLARPLQGFVLATGGMMLAAGLGVLLLWAGLADPAAAARFVDGHAPALLPAIPLVLALVLPGSLLAGLSFPLAQRAIQTDAARIGHRVGLVQLANILGNAAGSLVTGLLLLDLLGTAGTLRLLLVAGALFMAAHGIMARGLPLLAALAAAAAALPANPDLWARIYAAPPGSIVAEDRSGAVTIRREASGSHSFFIHGFAESSVPYLPVHAFLGSLGVLIHPAPVEVLVIGVAGGGTPYAAGMHKATRRIDAIDIVGATFDALDAFAARGNAATTSLLADPRYRFLRADGRHMLFAGGAAYDVIEADAMMPTTAFSGALYSVEFFRLAAGALKPGGVFVQWAPTPRVRDSFVRAFPHVVEVHPAGLMRPDRFVMLGAMAPIAITPAALAAAYRAPAVAARFRAADVDPERLARAAEAGRLVVWSPQTPRPATAVNEDLFPRDEFTVGD
ncbi:MAG: hypothetical protein NT133_19815, partial [Alphaproteobacteria bacterium]|nr:hypothetical protein [Alphaproteobacteria bacterium]